MDTNAMREAAKAARWVNDEESAEQVARILERAADEIDRLRSEIQLITASEEAVGGVVAALQAENARLRDALRWRRAGEEQPPIGTLYLMGYEGQTSDLVGLLCGRKGNAPLPDCWIWLPIPPLPEEGEK